MHENYLFVLTEAGKKELNRSEGSVIGRIREKRYMPGLAYPVVLSDGKKCTLRRKHVKFAQLDQQ